MSIEIIPAKLYANEYMICKLTTYEFVIGKTVEKTDNHITLFAPMSIDHHNGNNIRLSRYDWLSESVMTTFDAFHVVSVSIPNQLVLNLYAESWRKEYPSLEDLKKGILNRDTLNPDYMRDMFKDFLKSLVDPSDKKKIN